MHYHDLNSSEGIEFIKQASHNEALKGIAILKHSTRCSISFSAWNKLQRQWQWTDEQLPIYYLDLLSHRDVSNQIAEDFKVEHQSPQILIIKNGQCIYHTSHNGILASEIEEVIFSK
jgi:bacillithiol system protein YtxJ